MKSDNSRINEWFVPQFGPIRFRVFVGFLFLPYTAMCICFTLLGGLLSPVVHIDRVLALAIIYFLALGISAHAADGIGNRQNRPWANYISGREFKLLLVSGLVLAYSIGAFYIINYVPLLAIIAISEGFFLFAYNFELFRGFFHNNVWFSISWGALPFVAGFVMQTNSITVLSILLSFLTGFVSYVEIKLSRKYKALKKTKGQLVQQDKLEFYLKSISLGTISITIVSFIIAYFHTIQNISRWFLL